MITRLSVCVISCGVVASGAALGAALPQSAVVVPLRQALARATEVRVYCRGRDSRWEQRAVLSERSQPRMFALLKSTHSFGTVHLKLIPTWRVAFFVGHRQFMEDAYAPIAGSIGTYGPSAIVPGAFRDWMQTLDPRATARR